MPINTMRNRYIIRSRISERKFRQVLRLCLDIEAGKVARIIGVSRQTINKIFDTTQRIIVLDCEQCSP